MTDRSAALAMREAAAKWLENNVEQHIPLDDEGAKFLNLPLDYWLKSIRALPLPDEPAAGEDERETVAKWMIAHSYATGHADTSCAALLDELESHIKRLTYEDAAKIADQYAQVSPLHNYPVSTTRIEKQAMATAGFIAEDIRALSATGRK